MKVSVAMTTYNGEPFILQQLQSILQQTHEVDEVIICDDGSSDQTCQLVLDFIAEHSLTHWIFQQNQENMGFVANFLQTINKTTGDVVFLCDQDDVWKTEKVEQMLGVLEKHEEIMVLNTAVELIDQDNRVLPVGEAEKGTNGNILLEALKEDEIKQYDFSYLSNTNISPGCTICFRSAVKEPLKEFSEIAKREKFPHDWAVNLLGAAYFEGTYFWNRKLTGYRMHDHNTIGLDLEEKEKDEQEARIKSTLDLRIKNAREMLKMKTVCYQINQKAKKNKKVDEMYYVAKERLYFLEHLNVKNYLRLYRYRSTYKEMVSARGMISDALYALKLDGIFRK